MQIKEEEEEEEEKLRLYNISEKKLKEAVGAKNQRKRSVNRIRFNFSSYYNCIGSSLSLSLCYYYIFRKEE